MNKVLVKLPARVRRRVLFLGAGAEYPSVRIRCVQVAEALGCDYAFLARDLEIPKHKDLFILVKYLGDRKALRKRGIVVWDVIDNIPPLSDIDGYLFSTQSTRDLIIPASIGKKTAYVIPHHHCNFSNKVVKPAWPRRVIWLGGPQWKPALPGLRHTTVDSSDMSVRQVQNAYLHADILLNLRRNDTLESLQHRLLNTGIKLINAVGFGLPSVCSPEAAYYELAPECTLFATPAEAAAVVRRLRNDRKLYDDLRTKALAKRERFSLQTIAGDYARLLMDLATA